ncbi:MAG: glycosyltransferase [Thermodesulforhabdaceae bacterium]
MKIIYLSRSRFPSTAANSVNVMKMCEAFSLLGHDVLLVGKFETDDLPVVFDYYRVKHKFGLKPIPSWDGSATDPLYVIRSIWEAKKYFPDLVYSRSLEACFGVATLGIPSVYEIHAKPRTLLKRVLLKRLIAMPSLKRIVAITQGLACYLSREGFLKGNKTSYVSDLSYKLCVAHDGADPEDFNASVPVGFEDEANHFRSVFSNMPPDRLQVGYVGSLYPGKGMEIISEIVHLCPWANFHIVGGNKNEVALWNRRCIKNGFIPPNVMFYGFIPHALIGYICSFMDVALLPAQPFISNVSKNIDEAWHVSPLKLFEYMAAGVPVIASDLESLREVIEPGVTGLLVPPNDPAAWCNALSLLRDHPELRVQLGRKAREVLVNSYSWRCRAEKVLGGLQL